MSPEERRAYHRDYYRQRMASDPEFRESKSRDAMAYAGRNREKVRERHRKRYAERAKCPEFRDRNVQRVTEWRKANPDKQQNNARNYCARRRSQYTDDRLPYGAWRDIRAAFGHRCAYCAEALKLEQDHLEPLSAGGRHLPENVVPSCRRCNASKNDSTLLQWLARA